MASATLATLAGQPQALAALRRTLSAGKLHHAYLFEGPEGTEMARVAAGLAQSLQCDAPIEGYSGCGRCDSCLKVEHRAHPDVIWFDMTPKGLTERVRELLPVLAFRPFEGRARVIIFDPAHALAPVPERAEAANVVLKSLEEPPADTYFLLLTCEPRRLPITIRSRCQRLRFAPTSGLTEEPLEEEERARRDEQWEALRRALADRTAQSIFAVSSLLGGDRESALALTGRLWRALYAALMVHAQLEDRLSGPERDDADDFVHWPVSSIQRGLRLGAEAIEALRGNVAPALAIEHLVIEQRAGGER